MGTKMDQNGTKNKADQKKDQKGPNGTKKRFQRLNDC